MNGKKVLIIGANGMLGSNLVQNLGYIGITTFKNNIDISNRNDVLKELDLLKPDIIIHTAAYTNVEECEVNKNKSYLVNVIGTQNLVDYSIDKDILFVYISSTGIYGDSKTNELYNEFDEVHPKTIHHKSKFEGEKVVQSHLNKYLIIRTGWLYGGDKEHNKNFVYKRLLEASKNNVIFSDNSQIGNPTYILDLVEQIKILIENNLVGIFNCVNKAYNVTRYDYVKRIVELFDLKCEVKIAPEGMFKRVAPVSSNESATNYKLELLGLNIMADWENSLSKYILKLKSEL